MIDAGGVIGPPQEDAAAAAFRGSAAVGEAGYWRSAGRQLLRDRVAVVGLAIVSLLLLAALLAGPLSPYDPAYQPVEGLTLDGSPRDPSSDFLLGTDKLGRDELSRLLYGARVSLTVGIAANVLAAVLAVLLGGTAGLAGPRTQLLLMRCVDIILSFPILLLAIALLSVTNPNIVTIILLVGLGFGAYLARIVFTQVSSLREREFVLAARSSGVRSSRILVRHMIPHILPSIIVFMTLGIATAIQLEAALSYVGIGIQPPDASWGNMVSEGQTYLRTVPLLVVLPSAMIVLSMLGFGLLGDGLRDALDPTLEERVALERIPAR